MPPVTEQHPQEAAIAFGANLEDPIAAISKAQELLSHTLGLKPILSSSVWLTEPVGGPAGQNYYHNKVSLFASTLPPKKLLRVLLETESSLGRVRDIRWGPRVIDLDLIYLDQLILKDTDCTLPHPRMAERAFVLYPLLELRPNWRHPILHKTVTELIELLEPNGPQIKKL
ncbi:MAG: 2-amino-4-hydroxy-6-hydroxymethyldihydropteridine diphosphokinase [Deltaproteobacteria bacterium]|jgi:2-amino-4-hydroxy-6-hydroxymethyldihydropteridine diphosphokinase|nr:2-amino-4-hydroxy-6-hydroxymethyldihydropteridine diphosphokinase [Deltaproteobacteria bacterium]